MKKIAVIVAVAFSVFLGTEVYSFGPEGHATVGAIADKLLADKPVAKKIKELLDGITLERAAKLPDDIKGWDKKAPGSNHAFKLTGHDRIEMELEAFWKANHPTKSHPKKPNHRNFHFTDVPAVEGAKYSDGHEGRSNLDIVHLIPFCVRVLTGEESANNPRKITKSIAIILLAHFMGDVHQPLHVGAEYFADDGHIVNPDTGEEGHPDQGGNKITLVLNEVDERGGATNGVNFHGYWDSEAVHDALDLAKEEVKPEDPESVSHTDLISHFASHEPTSWKLTKTPGSQEWAIELANAIMPLATEAHDRLEFSNITITPQFANGVAKEKTGVQPSYAEWSAKVTKDQIHKAGWRLADLLEKSVR